MTRALIAGTITLGLAAPASAAPPELFVRESPWDTHEEVGDWIPLATAPVTNYVGGYEIGYRMQAAGFQRAALTVTGVPDGVPTQPPGTSRSASVATVPWARSPRSGRSCSSRATGATR